MSLRLFLVAVLAFQPAAGNWIYWSDQGCTGDVVQESNRDTTDSCEASYGAYLQKVSGVQTFSSQWDSKPYFNKTEYATSACASVSDVTWYLLGENYLSGLPKQVWWCNATHVWGSGGIVDVTYPIGSCFQTTSGDWARVSCSQTTSSKPIAPGDTEDSSATRLAFAGASLLLVLFTF